MRATRAHLLKSTLGRVPRQNNASGSARLIKDVRVIESIE